MAVSDRHKVKVEDEPFGAKYSYRVVCSCGWVGRCYTVQETDTLANDHLRAQGALTESCGIRSSGS
jgi:hypothetical protein